ALRDVEGDADRSRGGVPRPHERCGDVQVRVRVVDGRVRAVRAVCEKGVAHADGAVVARHVPLVYVRTRDLEGVAGAVRRDDVIDVFRELVERVAAGRGPAHPQLERPGRQVAVLDRDLRLVVLPVGEGDVVDRGVLRRGRSGCEQQRAERTE